MWISFKLFSQSMEKSTKFCYFRANYWYVNFYVLWVNAIFNILLPIGTLILLNILILRYKEWSLWCLKNFNAFLMSRRIKEHFQNLEDNLEQVSSNIRLRKVDIFYWKKFNFIPPMKNSAFMQSFKVSSLQLQIPSGHKMYNLFSGKRYMNNLLN